MRSPAGPFNHGLALAEAPWVGVMGSDDSFDPGAIDAMLRHLRADSPQVLLYPLRHQGGRPMANPLSRRWHHRGLDPVKDRLAYRTAPLALIRRELIADLGLLFTPGDAGELARCLGTFLQDSALLGRMQRAIAPPRGFGAYVDDLCGVYAELPRAC